MELSGPGRPATHNYHPLPGSTPRPPLPNMGQVLAQQRTAQAGQEDDGVTWWFRFMTRCVGTIAGFMAVILGIWVALSPLHPTCIAAGMIQMLFGFLTICMEAPCLCMWFDFIEKINAFSEARKHYQKGVVYGTFGLIPLILCFSVSTFFGAGLICVTGALYAMMAFGKKADRETMMAAAAGGSGGAGTPTDAWDAGLVANEQKHPQSQYP